MHEHLLDYFQKQHLHLEHYLALCIEKPDSEVVHQLRVSIKRIRAILIFTERLTGNKKFDADKQYKPLRKMFRMAGNIRDVHVQQKLVADYARTLHASFDIYIQHLNKLEKRSISRFFMHMAKAKTPPDLTSIRLVIESTMAVVMKSDISTRAFLLLRNQCDELRKKLENVPDNKQLHQMRTSIKQMHYILGVLSKSNPAASDLPISVASLNAAEELLGKWHDRIVGMELLFDFRKKRENRHEPGKENYNVLSATLESEQRMLRVQVRRMLEKALNSQQ